MRKISNYILVLFISLLTLNCEKTDEPESEKTHEPIYFRANISVDNEVARAAQFTVGILSSGPWYNYSCITDNNGYCYKELNTDGYSAHVGVNEINHNGYTYIVDKGVNAVPGDKIELTINLRDYPIKE